jgi:threonyl-tRNA synthetase
MLHRAILGSLERFIGILIENYAGKFPLWLSPIQVVVATISNQYDDFAKKIFDELKAKGIRVELDNSSEKISYKIREHSLQKIPYLVIIGKNEQENNVLTIRKFGTQEQQQLNLNDLIEQINNEINLKK